MSETEHQVTIECKHAYKDIEVDLETFREISNCPYCGANLKEADDV